MFNLETYSIVAPLIIAFYQIKGMFACVIKSNLKQIFCQELIR
jgi:hypothetical protein